MQWTMDSLEKWLTLDIKCELTLTKLKAYTKILKKIIWGSAQKQPTSAQKFLPQSDRNRSSFSRGYE